MSHFILRQPLVRARHALPHSHGRPLELRPRAGGARCAPRNLGVADAERAAQIFLLVNARASAKQPPSATSGDRSARAPVPGGLRDLLSRVKAAGRRAPAAGAAGGAAWGPAWGSGRLRAARLIVPGSTPAARTAGGTAVRSREARRRRLAPAQRLRRVPPPSSARPLRLS